MFKRDLMFENRDYNGHDYFHGYILPCSDLFFNPQYKDRILDTSFVLIKDLCWSIMNKWRNIKISNPHHKDGDDKKSKPTTKPFVSSDNYSESMETCDIDYILTSSVFCTPWDQSLRHKCGGVKWNKIGYPGCIACLQQKPHWSGIYRAFLGQSATVVQSASR